jgi:hypothetical protein
MGKHTYQYAVTIKDIDLLYVNRLRKYLRTILEKIQSGDRLKLILHSRGGNTDYMKEILALIKAIHNQGVKIDVYCGNVISAALILLMILKKDQIVDMVYAYDYANFMWHEPITFCEFSGTWKGNQFYLQGTFSKITQQAKELYLQIIQSEKEYLEWKEIYISWLQESLRRRIEEEIKEELHYLRDLAKLRNLVDVLL